MRTQRIIRLCYRKIIDSASSGAWESLLWEDTYKEFLMQAQFYNPDKKYTSFAQLLQYTKGADQLHFLVSAAAVGYIKQLNGIVPDVTNSLGKTFLPFSNFRFEIINSDTKDKSRLRIAIIFYSDELIWHESFGSQLLVSLPGKTEGDATLTEVITLQSFVSIFSLQEILQP